MSALSKHVIHQPRPLRRLAGISLAVIVTMILVWLYVDISTKQLQQQVTNLQQQNKHLISTKNEFMQSSQYLSAQLLEQEQHLAIQHEMDSQLKQQINDLQNEVVDLNRELAFYHNITQGSVGTELQVRELELLPDKLDKHRVHYRLVLTQGKQITKPIKGTVSLHLISGEEKQKLPIAEHTFKLRHVQVLTGLITTPDNTELHGVTVTYKQNKKKSRSQHFDWPVNAS